MTKRTIILLFFIFSFSHAFAELSDRMNYGWVNRAKDNNFDPSSLASSLGYFKNKCAANTEPCSPDSGVQADGSLFCATGNSTKNCYDLSKANNGLQNLKDHLTTKCGAFCLQAEKDFYPWFSKKVEFCKSRTKFNCETYNGEMISSIRSFYTPTQAMLDAPKGSSTVGSNKLIQDIPAGDQNSCDLVKGKSSRYDKNDSPYWKEVLSLSSKVCGKDVSGVTGYCSASVLPNSISSDLKNVFDRIRSDQSYDEDLFKKEMGMNINQFKKVFCAKDTYNFVQNANQVAKIVVTPGADFKYGGKSPWLQSCLSSGMVSKMADKVTSNTFNNGADSYSHTQKRYKTNTDESCRFIPVSDVAQALRGVRSNLMLMPKNPRPGTALCVLVKSINFSSDKINAARADSGLAPVPNSMQLYVPSSGAPPATYQFDSVGNLSAQFDAFKWNCTTAADYEVKQTGGDASSAEQ